MISKQDFKTLRPQHIWGDCEPEEAFSPEEDPEQLDYLLGLTCLIVPSVAAEFRYSKKPPFPLMYVDSYIRNTGVMSDKDISNLRQLVQVLGIPPAIPNILSLGNLFDCWAEFRDQDTSELVFVAKANALCWTMFAHHSGEISGINVLDPEVWGKEYVLASLPAVTPGCNEEDREQLIGMNFHPDQLQFLQQQRFKLISHSGLASR